MLAAFAQDARYAATLAPFNSTTTGTRSSKSWSRSLGGIRVLDGQVRYVVSRFKPIN